MLRFVAQLRRARDLGKSLPCRPCRRPRTSCAAMRRTEPPAMEDRRKSRGHGLRCRDPQLDLTRLTVAGAHLANQFRRQSLMAKPRTRRLPPLRCRRRMDTGIALAPVLLRALQADRFRRLGKRGVPRPDRRDAGPDDPTLAPATPERRERSDERLAAPRRATQRDAMRAVRDRDVADRRASSPPSAKIGSGARSAIAAKPSHPSVGAPACVGVGSTGPSTAKSSPSAPARSMSARVWHDAAHSRSSGRDVAVASAADVKCTPSQPHARASSASPFSSTFAPRGRASATSAAASARCRSTGQDFSRSWMSLRPRSSAASARREKRGLAQLVRHADAVDAAAAAARAARTCSRAAAARTSKLARHLPHERLPVVADGFAVPFEHAEEMEQRRARADSGTAARARARRGAPRDPAPRRARGRVLHAAFRRARACRRETPSSRRRPCRRVAARAAPGRPARWMIAAATRRRACSTLTRRARFSAQSGGAGVAPRELPRDAAAARAALQRELHRFAGARLGLARGFRRGDAERGEPRRDGGEVVVLAERIERDPQAEALGERDLLLDRFAGVNFARRGASSRGSR